MNVLSFFAVIITHFTISKLCKKQIFNASTTTLLIFNVSLVNIHNISYAFLQSLKNPDVHRIFQNWSFYRSFFTKIDDIIFESEECWPYHTTNEFTKVITFVVQFSLILNRILVTINPEKYSKSPYGTLLCILTLVAGCLFTIQQYSEGPTRGMMTASCSRESDVVEYIVPYITICMFSIFCSLTLICYVKRTSGKKTFDMMLEYTRRESMISTTAVTIIGTIQLLNYSFYALFSRVLHTWPRKTLIHMIQT
ncbi:hypothetical protein L3Y34_017140 [Caenorhabditis briggsae]|uniref:Uncharacterized protein n=1 Tax=Caenorhabditis briggsae TaxID=6238 RepID=A0AAE9DGX6_CAEBR|nr:hypothetical protein L3Y34_017140 [Caenorhabditis briggsae]